jgi:hypothetical protein
VYNDEIHIMGSGNSSYKKSHYKWTGTEWVSVSTLPYNFYQGSAVIYNNAIHIFGSDNKKTAHYKWNGTEWVSVGTLPYDFYQGSAVIYNNEIHIMGSYASSNEYKNFYHYSTEDSKWSKYLTESIPMQIVAHNHDDKADGSGKATLTFVAQNLLKDGRKFHSNGNNFERYSGSEIRTWLTNNFISTLPSELQTAISEVSKPSDGYNTNDKIWLLSLSELGFTDNKTSPTWITSGEEYSIFTDDASRQKKKVDASTFGEYWTRNTFNNTSIHYISSKGSRNTGSPTYGFGILFGFCI